MAKERTERKIDHDNRFGKPLEWAAAAMAGLGSGYYAFRKLVRTKFHDDAKNREGTAELFRIREQELADAANTRISTTLELFEEKIGSTPALERLNAARQKLSEEQAKAKGAKFTLKILEARSASEEALSKFMQTHADELHQLKADPKFASRFAEATKTYIKAVSAIKTRSDQTIDTFFECVKGFHSRGLKGNTIGLIQRFDSFGGYSKTSIILPTLGAIGAAFAVVTMAFNQFNTREKLNANDKATGEANERMDALLKKVDALAQDQKEEALQIKPDLKNARASQVAKLAERRASAEQAELATTR